MTRFKLAATTALFLVLLSGAAAYADQYAAMIMDMQNGRAEYAQGVLKGKQIDIMEFLYEGDVVSVPDGGTLVLNYFASETREELSGPAVIKIGTDKSTPVQADEQKIRRENLDYLPRKSDLDIAHSQNFGNVAMRSPTKKGGNGAQVKLLSLVNTSVRPNAELTLRWLPVEGADLYVVKVFDENRKTLSRAETSGLSQPLAAKLFTPGKHYFLTVSAMNKGKILAGAEGRFDVITADSARELAKAEQEIKNRYPKDSTEGLLSLALLYQGRSLKDDEATVLTALLKLHPNNPVVERRVMGLNPNLLKK